MSTEETIRPLKATSSRKAEANRRNAQHSTGPKTPEGKAKSSLNATTHGIFVKHYLHGAAPETIGEIQELAEGLQEYYEPEGILEELLVQKIVVETARYGRVLALEQLEQPEPGYNLARVVHCLDRTSRYSTATSRGLYRAIQELERLQAARKAREESAASLDAEPPKRPAELNEGQHERQGENPASSDSRAFEDPEDSVGKVEAA